MGFGDLLDSSEILRVLITKKVFRRDQRSREAGRAESQRQRRIPKERRGEAREGGQQDSRSHTIERLTELKTKSSWCSRPHHGNCEAKRTSRQKPDTLSLNKTRPLTVRVCRHLETRETASDDGRAEDEPGEDRLLVGVLLPRELGLKEKRGERGHIDEGDSTQKRGEIVRQARRRWLQSNRGQVP